MAKIARKYGWSPDLPDHRDLYRVVAPVPAVPLPPKVDLAPACPPVYDQGGLGSCTANAIGAAHQFEQMFQAKSRGSFVPSRLFIYYNERAMEGTIWFDAGAQIRDGIKSIAKQGVCPEPEWPYVPAKFSTKPPTRAYIHALQHQALQYQRVPQTLGALKTCLAQGHPIVFGFTVYQSFESQTVTRTGQVPMPRPGDKVVGGHAVLAVGYDDALGRFIVRNSWGVKWGKAGYCTMPYEYLTDSDLSADFWTITLVETETCKGARK